MARSADRVAGSLGACILVLVLAMGRAAAQAALPWEEPPREWLGIPAGGLNLHEAGGIVLNSLELTLSPDRVEATYSLRNEGDTPRSVDAGFPFPRITQAPTDGPPLDQAFGDASLTADGEALPLAGVRLHVFMRGVEVTGVLEAAGFPVQSLLSGDPAQQPRERRRAMEQALLDAGIAIDPAGWAVAIEPVWRLALPPGRTVLATLRYTPYPGRSLDQVPGEVVLEDLADLAGYCADAQPGLLDWMRVEIARRALVDGVRLVILGLPTWQAGAEAIAAIEQADLGFAWRSGAGWPGRYPQVELRIDAGPGRAAFCLPGTPDTVAPDEAGLYHAVLSDLPAEGRLDVLFLR